MHLPGIPVACCSMAVTPPSGRLVVEFSAREPGPLAQWWADALGWMVTITDSEATVVRPAVGPGFPLRFRASTRHKSRKNGVHLDLRSRSYRDQRAIVERLFNAGAEFADIGQNYDVPWMVLSDPEGNELCVLEPRMSYMDTGPLATIVIDCDDPGVQACAWASTTGMAITSDEHGFAALRATDEGPFLEFVRQGAGPDGMLRVVWEP
jgi:hypothetical protein